MADHAYDNHGKTPAAWTAVTLVMLGFLIGSIAVVMASVWLFVAGVVVIIAGAVAGKVMQMMGLGATPGPKATGPR
jgi:hypothetical protein